MLNAWTPEEDERLRSLVQKGASPLRAPAVLKRKRAAVIARARKLGCPIPNDDRCSQALGEVSE
jgi:hypothetical protein